MFYRIEINKKLNACTKYNTVCDVMVTLTSFLQRNFDSQNHSHFPFRSKPQA